MKTTLVLAFSLMLATSALANGVSQQQTANSNSDAQATNAGNSQSIIFTSPSSSSSAITQSVSGDTTSRVVYSGTQTVKNVPSVSGPPLVTSNDTCHGSMSGSLNIAGFGAGLGSTIVDKNCVMLKNSRELWNMGMRGAALARMCMDADNREALEVTGFACPQTDKSKKDEQVAQTQYTDPVVRARLGLPALTNEKK